jgi:predicted aspartyl protease
MTFRRIFGASLAALALTLPSPIRADDEATALLAKHKAYVGWEFGDGTFKTMQIDGTVSQLEKSGALKPTVTYIELRRGIVRRTTSTNLESGGESASGFTGKVFWFSDPSGQTVPVVSYRLKAMLTQQLIFDEATSLYPAVVLKNDTVAGKPVVVLREQLPSAISLDLYVDPQTGAYVRAIVDPTGRPTVIEIDGYSDPLPGKKTISSWHRADSHFRYVEKVVANPVLSDDDLRPPPQLATWTFAPPKPFPIEVQDKRIYVLAKFNGTEGRFILDTGAERSIFITSEFAKRAKLKAHSGFLTVGTLYGQRHGSYVDVNDLTFADGSDLKNVIATQVTSMPGMAEEHTDGLLGFSFLAGAIVDVDLDAARMTLYDPKTSAPDESRGAVFRVDLSSGTPAVPIKINGSASLDAFLDTGNPLYVLIPSSLIGKLRVMLDNDNPAMIVLMQGHGGVTCGKLDTIQLGAVSYNSPPFCYDDFFEPNTALVGLDLLKHFNLVFDYPDSEIIAEPRKNL